MLISSNFPFLKLKQFSKKEEISFLAVVSFLDSCFSPSIPHSASTPLLIFPNKKKENYNFAAFFHHFK